MDDRIVTFAGFALIGILIFELWLAARIGRKAGFRWVWLFILSWVVIVLGVSVGLVLLTGDTESSSAISLLLLIPLYYFAFKKWPALETAVKKEAALKDPQPIIAK